MHTKVNWFGLYWLAWILMFLVPELWWVFKNSANTLSEEYWGLEQLNLSHPFEVWNWTWQHWVLAFLVWFLFGWLSIHLPFGLAR